MHIGGGNKSPNITTLHGDNSYQTSSGQPQRISSSSKQTRKHLLLKIIFNQNNKYLTLILNKEHIE